MASIVYSNLAGGLNARGTLFEGKKFWLSQQVPSRTSFIEQIKANGGTCESLEKNADIMIVDHARKTNPPGTYSFRYIEQSIRNGVLEDLEDHRAGAPAGSIRTIGSARPAKGSRTPFTAEDDRVLIEWVDRYARDGGKVLGNEIYVQLEKVNSRHTYQSWRDHYIKKLKDIPRATQPPHNGPPTPPIDQPAATLTTTQPVTEKYVKRSEFTDEDGQILLDHAQDIIDMDSASVPAAWQVWADHFARHSALEWQNFWEKIIFPLYLKRKQDKERNAKTKELPVEASEESNEGRRQEMAGKEVREGGASQAAVDRQTDNDLDQRHLDKTPREVSNRSEESPALSSAESEDGNIDPSGLKVLSELAGPTSVKRKSDTLEDAIASSPPQIPFSSPLVKRIKLEQTDEIPSTPERGIPVNFKMRQNFLDLDDEFDGQESEDESSEREFKRQLSETLSEPTRTQEPSHSRQSLPLESSHPEEEWDPEPASSKPLEIAETQLRPQDTGAIPIQEKQYSKESLSSESLSAQEELDPYLGELSEPTPLKPLEIAETQPRLQDSRSMRTQGNHNSKKLLPLESLSSQEELDSDPGKSPEPTRPKPLEKAETKPRAEDTQAIFQGSTPILDFSIAEPEGGWDNFLASSPGPMPASSQGASEEAPTPQAPKPKPKPKLDTEDQNRVVDLWINSLLAANVDIRDIEQAYKCTGGDLALATEVAQDLKKKGRIPQRKRGVWTEEDDVFLQDVDARNIGKVILKHGQRRLDDRFAFLRNLDVASSAAV